MLENYGKFEKILLTISFSLFVISLFIVIITIYRLIPHYNINGDSVDLTSTGNIGDFIGGVVGTIGAFIGVILFFIALSLQRKELNKHIEELQQTRYVFQHQKFDSTFFNLIQNYNEIKNNLNQQCEKKLADEPNVGIVPYYHFADFYRGKLKQLYDSIQELDLNYMGEYGIKVISDLNLGEDDLDKILEKENDIVKVIYTLFYSYFQNATSHYYKNVFQILSHIYSSQQEELQNSLTSTHPQIRKKYYKYSNFFQAQMSNSELFLLFYHGLIFPNIKEVIQEYKFVGQLPVEELLDKDHEKYYSFSFKQKSKLYELLK